jgi:hypothetical protein
VREEDVLREAHNNMYAAADKMLQYRRNLSFFLIHLLLLSLSDTMETDESGWES